MRALEDQPPEGLDRPPVEFWENTLEFPVTRLLEDAESPNSMNDWIGRRAARQVAMLRHLLGLRVDAPPRERKAELKDRHDELLKFVPASHFAIRKSRDATLDVAVDCLDETVIAAGTPELAPAPLFVVTPCSREASKPAPVMTGSREGRMPGFTAAEQALIEV